MDTTYFGIEETYARNNCDNQENVGVKTDEFTNLLSYYHMQFNTT